MRTEFKVTKKLIEKLEAQPIVTSVRNGWFRRAVVEVKWYGSDLKLEVSVGHPILSALMHPSWKDEETMVYYQSGQYAFSIREIPKELQDLAGRMRKAATISDDVAKQEYKALYKGIRQSFEEMGLVALR